MADQHFPGGPAELEAPCDAESGVLAQAQNIPNYTVQDRFEILGVWRSLSAVSVGGRGRQLFVVAAISTTNHTRFCKAAVPSHLYPPTLHQSGFFVRQFSFISSDWCQLLYLCISSQMTKSETEHLSRINVTPLSTNTDQNSDLSFCGKRLAEMFQTFLFGARTAGVRRLKRELRRSVCVTYCWVIISLDA